MISAMSDDMENFITGVHREVDAILDRNGRVPVDHRKACGLRSYLIDRYDDGVQVAEAARMAIDEFYTPYFYRPIDCYAGAVLKCAGRATDENRAVMMAVPGTIELPGYRGDRIDAATHRPFNG
jgi:hypothetical protein